MVDHFVRIRFLSHTHISAYAEILILFEKLVPLSKYLTKIKKLPTKNSLKKIQKKKTTTTNQKLY